MHRLYSGCALAGLVLLAGAVPALRGQDSSTGKKTEAPAKEWLLDRSLTLTPAAAPVPALRYRLFPRMSERREGNAAPIYMRLVMGWDEQRKKQLGEQLDYWLRLPLEGLPRAEVKKFLDSRRYHLHQIELAARRRTADWSYTLDAGSPIELLLPDVQEIRRSLPPLLLLKARLEIAEGHYGEAIHTLETGLSLAQQLSEAPFIISALIGIAVASQMSDSVLELMEQPDAPNLYWALTVLPRPPIDMRRGNEFEEGLFELQFPDLADLDRPRSAQEWDGTLRRFRTEVERIIKMDTSSKGLTAGNGVADPASASPDLPEARKYLARTAGMAADKVDAMHPAQVLLLYLVHFHHEMRDEVFKAVYLPYPQGRAVFDATAKRLKAQPDTQAKQVLRLLVPALVAVQSAQVRIERKLEALRVLEALRMHAAAHDGQLPDRLEEVTVVPIPNDPGTGKAFAYKRDGDSAILTSLLPGEPGKSSALRFRVKMRKKGKNGERGASAP
jgi:hypothetical protein